MAFIQTLVDVRDACRRLAASLLVEQNNKTYRHFLNSKQLHLGKISLYWWYPGYLNFGDALSPLIVMGLSGRELSYPLLPDRSGPNLLAVGSILKFANEGDLIWGAGLRTAEDLIKAKRLDIRAVRGPLTRDVLLKQGFDCPKVYGDPALLMPRLFKPSLPAFRYKVGIIKHLGDRTDWGKQDSSVVRMINVRDNPLTVIEQICSCDVILSSSLHGVIIAEAYGIPVCCLSPESSLWKSYREEDFKYRDYYLSTSRDLLVYTYAQGNVDIDKAIGMALSGPKPVIDLEPLLMSFPFLK